MKDIILGTYSCGETNGILHEIYSEFQLGTLLYKSYHYKILIDGNNKEIPIHLKNDALIDNNGKIWKYVNPAE